MRKASHFLLPGLFLAFILVNPSSVRADTAPVPAVTASTCPMWQATYFDDTRGYNAPPVVRRDDAQIDFDWGHGAPAPGMVSDHFSVRWLCTAHFPAGTYRFTATSDDGITLFIDGQPVIEAWFDHPVRTFTRDLALAEGDHQVTVTYYENTGLAEARVSWAPLPASPDVWVGQYYDNATLSGSPVRIRVDADIDFDWQHGSPDPRIPSDNFSVAWTRSIQFEPGLYRFVTTTDDGVRLWVGDEIVIDQWHDQPAQFHSGTIYLSGEAVVRMEVYEHTGLARAHMRWIWVRSGQADELVVDDGDPGFVKGGDENAWRSEAGGSNGHCLWTRNNDRVRPDYNWARWYPDLAAGRYDVYVFIPDHIGTTTRARYWISHQNGYTLRSVNQSASSGWTWLGTYWFQGSRRDYVSLADVTFEPYLSSSIAFDAVWWVAH